MGYRDGNADVPDPGSATSPKAERMRLRCRDCSWHVSSTAAEEALRQARTHHAAMKHVILYRNVPQEWSRSDEHSP